MDYGLRTTDKRRKTKEKRRKTSQRLSLDFRHKKMKKHLLIITALFISATSCKGGKEIVCITDTVYISKQQYDSVFIDRQSATTTSGDTVFVNRMQTEYRYKLKTDTLHLHHTDTIVQTIHNKTPPEKPPPTNLKYLLVVLCLILSFSFLFRLIRSKA